MEAKLLCSAIWENGCTYYHIPSMDKDAIYITVYNRELSLWTLVKIVAPGNACEYQLSRYIYTFIHDGRILPEMIPNWNNRLGIISNLTHPLDPIISDVTRHEFPYNINEPYDKPPVEYTPFQSTWLHNECLHDVKIIYKICNVRADPMRVVLWIYVCSVYLQHIDWFFVTITIRRNSTLYGPYRISHIQCSPARAKLQYPELMHPAYIVVDRSMYEGDVPEIMRDIIKEKTEYYLPLENSVINFRTRSIYFEHDERTIMWQLIHTWYHRGLHCDVISEILEWAGMRAVSSFPSFPSFP